MDTTTINWNINKLATILIHNELVYEEENKD